MDERKKRRSASVNVYTGAILICSFLLVFALYAAFSSTSSSVDATVAPAKLPAADDVTLRRPRAEGTHERTIDAVKSLADRVSALEQSMQQKAPVAVDQHMCAPCPAAPPCPSPAQAQAQAQAVCPSPPSCPAIPSPLEAPPCPVCPAITTAASEDSGKARLGSAAWAATLLSAAPRAAAMGEVGASFTKFTVDIPGGASGEGSKPVSFWYAIQDTLHSAGYIMEHETGNLAFGTSTLASAPPGKPCYVLDIGSNGGFFSLLSRAYGCHVLAVDAQPRCIERLQSSAALNGFTSGLTARWTAVSSTPGQTIETGATRCSGLWAVDPALHWINKESDYNVKVNTQQLEALVQGWLPEGADITLMKVDVEGSEVEVWKSALPLLRGRKIRHIMAEVVPGRVDPITPWADVESTLSGMYSAGYACGLVGSSTWPLSSTLDFFRPNGRTPVGQDWFCSLQ